MLVKNLAAASSSVLDARGIARAYLEIVTRDGNASWGAVYALRDDEAVLLAAVPDDVEFAEFAAPAELCDGGSDVRTGLLPETAPPGSSQPAHAEGYWVLGSIRYGGECMGAVVLGFPSQDVAPHAAVLEDAFARLSSAMHNSRLYEEQALAARLNRLLDEADVRMLASAAPEDVVAIARNSLEEGLGTCSIHLALPDSSQPKTRQARTDVRADGNVLDASFRVLERPGSMHLEAGPDRRSFSGAEIDFASRLLSTMALAVESRMLQLERESIMLAREEWVADLSHDIRTPLASIRGYAELLSTGEGIPEQEVRREAGLIARQATAIERLVEDLRTAFQLRFNRLPVSATATDLTPIVEEALEAALWHAGRGRREVPFEHPAEPVFGMVDTSHFSRVVANLATNAFVHNPPETKVSAVLTSEGGRAHLTIADNGLGMDPQLTARACRRGERGSASSAPGSGLGMAIVHELTNAMGGQVRVESREGMGTAVTVSVPLAPDATDQC